MLFAPRANLRQMSGLCRRMSTALEAGVDLRQVVARETQTRPPGALRNSLGQIQQEVSQGGGFAEAVDHTGRYFPPLFVSMVEVGEKTGQLPEVLRMLALHYERQQKLRRIFLAGILWPMIQLGIALFVVGLVIWLMGIIPAGPDGKPYDLFGFGLTGNSGLIKYLIFLAVMAGGGVVLFQLGRRGSQVVAPIQKLLMRVPALGKSLQTLAIARLAWTLHATMQTGMNMASAVQLSLRATQNARYTQWTTEILDSVTHGDDLSLAFERTGVFPEEVLETLQVGEQSGRVPESMAVLARQYEERAELAFQSLTVIAGFAVWGMVAILVIFLIFRVFSFYIQTLNSFL